MSTVLQRNTRLHNSMVWQTLSDYYQKKGRGAWQKNEVPQFALTNRYTASYYCYHIAHICRQCWQEKPDEEVLILDCGAGSGEFMFHFLPLLQQACASELAQGRRLTVVMTDIVDSNIQTWQTTPCLEPLFASGHLDVCQLNACEAFETLTLQRQQRTVQLNQLQQPLILIANYLFDCLPIDQINMTGETTYLSSVTLKQDTHDSVVDTLHVQSRFDIPLDELKHPHVYTALQEIEYHEQHSCINFPTAAIGFLKHLNTHCTAGFIVMCSDFGSIHEENIAGSSHPLRSISTKSPFWLAVDFYSLNQWLRSQGGRVDILHDSSRLHSQIMLSHKTRNISSQPHNEDDRPIFVSPIEILAICHTQAHTPDILANHCRRFGINEYLLATATQQLCQYAKKKKWFSAILKQALNSDDIFLSKKNHRRLIDLARCQLAVDQPQQALQSLMACQEKQTHWLYIQTLYEAYHAVGDLSAARQLYWRYLFSHIQRAASNLQKVLKKLSKYHQHHHR